jgi:hypothetical protein
MLGSAMFITNTNYLTEMVLFAQQVIDLASGTFNTSLFRLNALVAVGCLQV